MGRLAGFKYREVVRKLRRLGFIFDRQASGSHEAWKNMNTQRVVIVPCHSGDFAEGTLRSILRDAGVDVDDFLNA